jgi:hypothetical protein
MFLSTALATLVVAVLTASTADAAVSQEQRNEPLPRQVVAIYFHRTVRCPTCKRVGAMAEEAVVGGFAKQVKSRTVEFRYIDFQDEKNTAIVNRYKITGPALVLTNVFDGRIVRWEPLPKAWQLFAKPDEFRQYVQGAVTRYLNQTRGDAQREQAEGARK